MIVLFGEDKVSERPQPSVLSYRNGGGFIGFTLFFSVFIQNVFFFKTLEAVLRLSVPVVQCHIFPLAS